MVGQEVGGQPWEPRLGTEGGGRTEPSPGAVLRALAGEWVLGRVLRGGQSQLPSQLGPLLSWASDLASSLGVRVLKHRRSQGTDLRAAGGPH